MSLLPDPIDALDEQGQALHQRLSGPRRGIEGMYKALLHHVPLAEVVSELGSFLRFDGVLGSDVKEVAILAVARRLEADFVWQRHLHFARTAGLTTPILEALAAQRASLGGLPLYDDVQKVAACAVDQAALPPALFDSLQQELGSDGLVELVAICGFYRFIATIVFSFDVQSPSPDRAPFAVDQP